MSQEKIVTGKVVGVRNYGNLILVFVDEGDGKLANLSFDHGQWQSAFGGSPPDSHELIDRRIRFDGVNVRFLDSDGLPGLFPLGRLLATPGALEALNQSGQSPAIFLQRHAAGDWGEVDAEDRQLNDQAVKDGSRLLSAYHTARGTKVWVITEAADEKGYRAATTILLPDEY